MRFFLKNLGCCVTARPYIPISHRHIHSLLISIRMKMKFRYI